MAQNGGRRPGAGRPKGAVSRKSAAIIEAIEASGEETPLQYMLRVMRDRTVEHTRRDDMAKAAAGYVHPKLASTDNNLTGDVNYNIYDGIPPKPDSPD
jgi:hypothetical protein